MPLNRAIRYPATYNSKQGIQCLTMLLVSALCAVLITGCFAEPKPKPLVIGLKPVATLAEIVSEVDQLPTFRWEQFPREKDRAELDPNGSRIAEVSYEFRLWKAGARYSLKDVPRHRRGTIIGEAYDYKYSWDHECQDTNPGELVLSEKGLLNPQYIAETPLEPDSYYFWSVRAHFTLDGKRRATEWSEQLLDFVLIGRSVLYREYTSVAPPGLIGSDGCSSHKASFHLIHTRSSNPVEK
jgi:hypothetical protein